MAKNRDNQNAAREQAAEPDSEQVTPVLEGNLGQTDGTTASGKAKPKTYRIHLRGGKGEIMHVEAYPVKGGASSVALHDTKDADGNKLRSRGATENHTSMDAAIKRAEELASNFVKLGWSRNAANAGAGGFKKRPDTFDVNSLPAPSKG